jgi:hypothetical protein
VRTGTPSRRNVATQPFGAKILANRGNFFQRRKLMRRNSISDLPDPFERSVKRKLIKSSQCWLKSTLLRQSKKLQPEKCFG